MAEWARRSLLLFLVMLAGTAVAYIPNPGLVAGSRGSFAHRLVAAAIPVVVPLVEHAPHLRA